ncbi:MAG: hypothetical protein WCQ00_02585 [bacterium]
MGEKHQTPETFFDVAEIYNRLDQVIYDHREEEEKYGRVISDEMTSKYESALNILIHIRRMHPQPDSEKAFIKVLDDVKEKHGMDESVYSIIIQQVY